MLIFRGVRAQSSVCVIPHFAEMTAHKQTDSIHTDAEILNKSIIMRIKQVVRSFAALPHDAITVM